MKLIKTKNRQLVNLFIVLVTAVVFSIFSMSIDFLDRLYIFLNAYVGLPITKFLVNVIFLWLAGLLLLTYRRWRETARKQAELENVIESISPDALMVVDPDRNIIMCNTSMKRMFGYEVDEVINQKTDLLYFDRRSAPGQRHEIFDILESDGFHIGLATGKKKNGETIPLEIITGNLSGHCGAVLLLRDITERKQSEEALRASEEKYKMIVRSIGEVIFQLSPLGFIQYVSPRVKELYGYEPEELIGKRLEKTTPMSEVPKAMEALKAVLSGKVIRNFEINQLDSEGKIVPVEVTITPVEKEGEIIAVQGVMRDITERKKAEEKIIQAKKEWEETFDSVTESIIIIDPDYNILRANQATFEELKLPFDKTIGKKCYRIFYNRKEPCELCGLRETLDKKEPVHLEKYDPLFGKTLEYYTYPSFDEKGEIRRIIIYRRDITELTKLQEQIIRTEKITALGRMASGIAHDFNNALAAILGLSKLLLLKEDNLQKIKDIKSIETVSKDAAQMVRRLQEFTGIRKTREGFVGINVNETIKEAIEITKPIWKDKVQAEGITIDVKTDLTPIPHISGNASEIREVLTNMIFNSVDAMPAGGKLTLSSNLSKDKGFIEININDTGVGMSEEVRRQVFDPLFTTKGVTHTGMGLSVSYGIITRHGGEIDVKSTEGKGSTFTIRFPVSKEIREEIREKIPKKRFKKAKVLMIEDEELVRNTLGRILETFGHKVTKASTSKEGLRRFKRGKFDMVLTDLGMPELSGWEIASMVKQINPSMPVVMITGWGDQFSEEKLETNGVDLVLSKPFEPDKLKEVIRKALEIKDGGRRE